MLDFKRKKQMDFVDRMATELEQEAALRRIELARSVKAAPPTEETTPPAPIPATRSLTTNLQSSIAAYNRRAEQLTAEINSRQSEHADVIRARDAATLALEALLGDVMAAAVEEDLAT